MVKKKWRDEGVVTDGDGCTDVWKSITRVH